MTCCLQSLAAEVVALEEKVLHVRSREIRLEKEGARLQEGLQEAEKQLQASRRDRAGLQSTIDMLQVCLHFSFIPSFMQLFIQSVSQSVSQSFVHSFIHSFSHSFVRSFIHSCMHALFIHSCTSSPVHSLGFQVFMGQFSVKQVHLSAPTMSVPTDQKCKVYNTCRHHLSVLHSTVNMQDRASHSHAVCTCHGGQHCTVLTYLDFIPECISLNF